MESGSGLESDRHGVLCVGLCHETLSELSAPGGNDVEAWHCLGQRR